MIYKLHQITCSSLQKHSLQICINSIIVDISNFKHCWIYLIPDICRRHCLWKLLFSCREILEVNTFYVEQRKFIFSNSHRFNVRFVFYAIDALLLKVMLFSCKPLFCQILTQNLKIWSAKKKLQISRNMWFPYVCWAAMLGRTDSDIRGLAHWKTCCYLSIRHNLDGKVHYLRLSVHFST